MWARTLATSGSRVRLYATLRERLPPCLPQSRADAGAPVLFPSGEEFLFD